MKAMVCERYGPPGETIHLADVPEPVVGPDDVLVRVHAAGLNPLDWHCLTGTPRIARPSIGLRRPRGTGVGADLAGVVEAVGPAVTRFAPGDEVFGAVGNLPGTSFFALGTVAELASIPERRLQPKPATVGFDEAAGVGVAAMTAMRALRPHDVGPGRHVLVHGASGGVGSFMVQLAAARGARVTGVCSTPNVAMVRSLGAADVVDYTRTDPTQRDGDLDLVLDNVGNRSPAAWRHALVRDGTYVANFGRKEATWLGPFGAFAMIGALRLTTRRRWTAVPSAEDDGDLAIIAGMLAGGTLRTVVGRTYAMADTGAAVEHVGAGHVRGKCVVTVQED